MPKTSSAQAMSDSGKYVPGYAKNLRIRIEKVRNPQYTIPEYLKREAAREHAHICHLKNSSEAAEYERLIMAIESLPRSIAQFEALEKDQKKYEKTYSDAMGIIAEPVVLSQNILTFLWGRLRVLSNILVKYLSIRNEHVSV